MRELNLFCQISSNIVLLNLKLPFDPPRMKKWFLWSFLLFSFTSWANSIDQLVDKKLSTAGISASPVCSDEVFLRRVHLVLTGRIPDPEAAKAFLESKDPLKRQALIDRLVGSPAFVDQQVLKWGDLLRIKSEFPSNLWPNAVQAYNRFLKEEFTKNVPYDQFVKKILLSSGSNFRSPQVNFYRAFQKRTPENIVDNIGALFLGMRDVPGDYHFFFDQVKYKKTDEWKEEIVYVDRDLAPKLSSVRMDDGSQLYLAKNADNRVPFVEWLVSPENTQFSEVMANRIWYWLMGRGIVDAPDDFRRSNPPSNPELLKYLGSEFVKNQYNIQHIFRLILNSKTFQRASVPTAGNASDSIYFSHYLMQRLTAEAFVDATGDITGVHDKYMSKVPEPYSYFPEDTRASTLGDGTVSSSVLELFGRPSRDNSFEKSRINDLNYRQVLYLLNSSELEQKLQKGPGLQKLYQNQSDLNAIIEGVYLLVLSRYPTPAEKKYALSFKKDYPNPKTMTVNLTWALINSKEFIFNH